MRRSCSATCSNSGTPDGTRKHLNPTTPARCMARNSPALPGTTPPQKPTFTQHFLRAAVRLASSAAAVVVAGTLLSGMSISVVMPPAAAARVAVSKPSQSLRPGRRGNPPARPPARRNLPLGHGEPRRPGSVAAVVLDDALDDAPRDVLRRHAHPVTHSQP